MKLISKGLMIAVVLGMAACADGEDRSDADEQSVAEEVEGAPLAQLERPRLPGLGDGGIPGFPGGRLDPEAIKDAIEKLRGAGFPGFPSLGDGGLPGFPGGRAPDADAIKELIEKLRDAAKPALPTDGKLPDADAIAKALKDIAAKLREAGFTGLPADDKLPTADAIKDFLDKIREGGTSGRAPARPDSSR